jgi:hypothetical protein
MKLKQETSWMIPSTKEEAAWYEAGLSAHGVNLDKWDQEAVLRYGRLLVLEATENYLAQELILQAAENEIDRLRAEIDRLKLELKNATEKAS